MPRIEPPYAADERTMLLSFLEYFRETMCAFVEGLTPEQLRWIPCEDANSIAGMLRHLWFVEEWWFQNALTGVDGGLWDESLGDGQDFLVPDDMDASTLVSEYRRLWGRSNANIDGVSLDTVAIHPDAHEVTLRWILVHMIEETARHAGHADITRQLIDGKTEI